MFDTLTLDQLRLFVAVAEEGSFSAAARRLRRVQSAVSYGMANLESVLGVSLFDRSGRRPALTPSGEALLRDARQVLAQVGVLQTRAATLSEGLESEVSVVVDAIVPSSFLVSLCCAFREAFPTVSLRLQTEVLESVLALVLDGTCDLGIAGPLAADQPALESRFLAHVPMVPVASAAHPLASLPPPLPTSAVRDHVQVVISERSRPMKSPDHGVLSQVTWRVADAATKLDLIRAGLGWGNLPLEMVRPDLEDGSLVRLHLEVWGPEPREAAIHSVVRADKPPGPAGQWLLGRLATFSRRCPQLEAPSPPA